MPTATVIHGYRNGSKFGFPTANLQLDTPIDIENGVYAAQVQIDSKIYKGMLYVGTRPTLNLTEKTYEMHLLHFSGNLYGKTLSFEIVEYIRPEQKFESVEALVEQLKRDRETVEAMFNEK
jgi:riboflavin kinase/FMN adenylyltransferase